MRIWQSRRRWCIIVWNVTTKQCTHGSNRNNWAKVKVISKLALTCVAFDGQLTRSLVDLFLLQIAADDTLAYVDAPTKRSCLHKTKQNVKCYHKILRSNFNLGKLCYVITWFTSVLKTTEYVRYTQELHFTMINTYCVKWCKNCVCEG